jgi:DNA-binding NarL/FixJ family response regulator
MRILIIDDHAAIHHGLRRILDNDLEAATFGSALNAQEALELLSHQSWDVVILDISLPGRSGLDLLKQVRADRPRLPILIFSMYPEEQYAVRALKAGASGYLAKGSPPEQLVVAIQKVQSGGRYVSPALAEKLAANVGGAQSPEPHEILTDREFEVLHMMASGKTQSAIASELSLSVKTVSTYRTRILEKLGLNATSELIRYAVDHGLDH